ncbi:MAG: thioredoxin [Ruminococcaceae bacterium]|nr:thioredoxin [Oscillospiraceae bacterium]
MSELIITKENFEEEVLNSDIPVLLDFWASWCGPCRMLSPIISEISEEYEGKIKVGKVNIDDEQELSMDFNIVSIPTVIYFKDGKVQETLVGYREKEEFTALFE